MDKDNKNNLSLGERRKLYQKEQEEKLQNKEMAYLKNSIRRDMSGRPKVASNDLTTAGLLGKFAGKSVLIGIVIILIIMALIGSTLIGILVGYIATAKEVPSSLFTITQQTSYLYDKNGEQIAALTGDSNINRELIDYSQVSQTYIDEAFIAIEDRTFNTNIGIDPRRIAGAAISTLANLGDSAHGGSTITQQTVKMLTGDNEVSYQRKVQEWYRAVRLTEQLPKAKIMNLYLDLVPMGNNYVGVGSAAKAYFGKEAKDLNLAESALLAGIPKSPASYNPRTELGRKNIQRRQRIVLQAMLSVGFITSDQFEDAINYEIVYSNEDISFTGNEINSYFEEFVIEQVTRDLANSGKYTAAEAYSLVQNGGLHIHTSLDPLVQDKLDELFLQQKNFQRDPSLYVNSPEKPDAGTVVLDSKTNNIVAMQGGAGEKEANKVLNRATDIRRQPGSVIKPLAVYAPAVEMDLVTGATMVKDEPVHMDIHNPNTLWPTNAYDSYYGAMPVRGNLKISSNVPAVKVLNEVGVDTAKTYLAQMGIDLRNDPVGLSLATGSLSYGVSPLQMANGFQTLANGGLYTESKAYTQVLDSNGVVILEFSPEFEQVFSAETSYMMLRMMEDVLKGPSESAPYYGTLWDFGQIHNANGEIIRTAGKTGTTDAFQDEWIAMMTPYYTVSNWYGFDNKLKRSYLPTLDYKNQHYATEELFKYIHRDKPAAEWDKPAGIVEFYVSASNGYQVSGNYGNSFLEYFKAGSPITPNRPSNGDINYLNTDKIPGYYNNFAASGGYQ